jgi:TonB-linked SusC/RagA family outer membrane protein
MKLTLIIFFVTLFGLQANNGYAQKTKITMDVSDASLREIIDNIETTTDFKFIYKTKHIDVSRKLSLKADKESITTVLDKLFPNKKVGYKMRGAHIILKPNPKANRSTVVAQPTTAVQAFEVSGTITDNEGTPLPGASILEKGTTNGTQTDFDGKFNLNVANANAILVVSYIGYATEEIAVNGQNEINISLKDDAAALEEVVVVGYGTVKRETLSGAVATLQSEELADLPLTSTLSGIQGRIPGAVVTRSNGRPGAEGYNIQIRGATTVNGNSNPLIIIDGIAGSMTDLNPNDIETYTVLKDASAAIYGARASNGVILITTKKGKDGKPSIDVNTSYSIRKRADFFEQLNSYQVSVMNQEAVENAGGGGEFSLTPEQIEAMRNETGEAIQIPYGTVYARTWDYSDLAFTDGSQQNVDLNISGATNKISYRTSFGYLKEEGLLAQGDDDNQRLNGRVNLGFKPNEKLNIETRLAFSRQRTRNPNQSGLGQILRIFPFMTPYTEADPSLYAITQGFQSPLQRHEQGGTNTYWDTRLEANAKMDYQVVEHLTLTGQVGSNLRFQEINEFGRTYILNDEVTGEQIGRANSPNWGREQAASEVYTTLIGYLNYANTFGTHNLSITGGASHEQFERGGFWAQRTGYPSNDFFSLNLGDSENQTNGITTGNSTSDVTWTIRSLFGRASYVLDNKYIFEFNSRYDGSSRFHPDTRWGFFWGASGAWQLGEENFIKNLDFFDSLKMRLSYSETGNQEGIGLYDYIGTVSISGAYPFGDGGRISSAHVGNLVDPTRTWETIRTKNIGLDFSILDNRLSGSFDYFVKNNIDMLVPLVAPTVIGSPLPSGNNGELETKGWELSLNWQDNIGADFSYFLNFNMGDAKNIVVNYGGQDTYNEGRVGIREGYALDTYHGWIFDGIIQNQEQLDAYSAMDGVPGDIGIGDAMFKDVNGDGRISTYGDDGETGDVVPIGNPTPRYNYGINLGATYKNWEFSAFIQGVGEKDIFLDGDWSAPWFWPWHKPDARFWNTTWSPDRPDAKYPRLSHGNIRRWNYNKNTNTMLDASYVRLKNVSIGYNLPKSVTESLNVQRLKLYFTGFDLWEKHNLGGGFDPEGLSATQTVPQAYPFSRMYSLGINVTF